MRLSVRSFADHLGVGHRTIGRSEASGPDAVLRPDLQAFLDAMLTRADDTARDRFATLLAQSGTDAMARGANDATVTTPGPHRAEDASPAKPTLDSVLVRQRRTAVPGDPHGLSGDLEVDHLDAADESAG